MTNEQILKRFADNFNYYLSQLGYTQKDIAEKLGVTQQAVNTWATGKNVPRMDKAQKLAQILNIKISDLTEEREHKEELRPDINELVKLVEQIDKDRIALLTQIAQEFANENRQNDERK